MKLNEVHKSMDEEESLMRAFNKEEEDARERYFIEQTCLEEGRIEGREEGQTTAKYNIAKAMKESKVPIDTIIKCTGLSKSKIISL